MHRLSSALPVCVSMVPCVQIAFPPKLLQDGKVMCASVLIQAVGALTAKLGGRRVWTPQLSPRLSELQQLPSWCWYCEQDQTSFRGNLHLGPNSFVSLEFISPSQSFGRALAAQSPWKLWRKDMRPPVQSQSPSQDLSEEPTDLPSHTGNNPCRLFTISNILYQSRTIPQGGLDENSPSLYHLSRGLPTGHVQLLASGFC